MFHPFYNCCKRNFISTMTQRPTSILKYSPNHTPKQKDCGRVSFSPVVQSKKYIDDSDQWSAEPENAGENEEMDFAEDESYDLEELLDTEEDESEIEIHIETTAENSEEKSTDRTTQRKSIKKRKHNAGMSNSQLHVIEKVMARRTRKNKVEFLVKWKDFPGNGCTWEPESHLNEELVDRINELIRN